MKKCRKIFSVLLVGMLIAVQLIPIINVKAEGIGFVLSDTITKEDDPNSKLITNNDLTVTITNFEDTSTAYISGFKIIDVFYNEETNEVSYQFTESFRTFLDSDDTYKNLTVEQYFQLTSDNPDGSASTSIITASTLNILLSKYLINGSSSPNISFDEGVVTTSTAEVGVYVLKAKGTKGIYGVMSANVVPVVNSNGEWTIVNPTVVAKKSEVSNQSLTVTKQVVDMKQMIMAVDLQYKLTIPELPTNMVVSDDKSFTFVVMTSSLTPVSLLTLRNGDTVLTIDENGKVYNGEQLVENIVVDPTSGTVEIKDITKLSSRDFTTTYTGNINAEEIVFGELGNSFIGATSYDSQKYQEGVYRGWTAINVSAYSYAIGVQNLEKDTEDVLLNGANYELYRSYDAETNTLSDKVDIDFAIIEGVAMTVVTEPGKYYVKQVRAPSGYRLSKDIIEIDVNPGSVNEQDAGMYMGIVYNEKMWFLPSTGGLGTIIYTLVGLMVVGVSTCGIVYYRKKRLTVN